MAGLRWWRQETPIGPVTVVASPSGIRAVGLPGDGLESLVACAEPSRDDALARALDEWFAGDRRGVDVPVDLVDVSDFGRRVLETLRAEVEWGETVTYAELAAMAGRPGAARAVGSVMAGNPVPCVVPCHRVIAAGGRIGGYGGTGGPGGGRDLKRALLAREGVHPRE